MVYYFLSQLLKMMQCGYLAAQTPQSQCFSTYVFDLSSNSNNFCWLKRVVSMDSTLNWSLAKCFSVVTIFGSEGTGGMVIDWDPSRFSSCSSNWVIYSFRIVFYRSFGYILVTCILILHFLCEHLYPSTQLVNHFPQLTDSLITINCINYSESQQSVLRQETVCTSC